jgi:hypothetical protein
VSRTTNHFVNSHSYFFSSLVNHPKQHRYQPPTTTTKKQKVYDFNKRNFGNPVIGKIFDPLELMETKTAKKKREKNCELLV